VSRDLFSYRILMYSHSLVVSRLKVFFIDCHLFSSGMFFIPGSVQHIPVVIQYLGSVYNAFVVFHEGFIFLNYGPLLFFNVLLKSLLGLRCNKTQKRDREIRLHDFILLYRSQKRNSIDSNMGKYWILCLQQPFVNLSLKIISLMFIKQASLLLVLLTRIGRHHLANLGCFPPRKRHDGRSQCRSLRKKDRRSTKNNQKEYGSVKARYENNHARISEVNQDKLSPKRHARPTIMTFHFGLA
jgi:hypothetical protein